MFIVQRQGIALQIPGFVIAAKYLLAARPVRLAAGALAACSAGIIDKLVGAIEIGCICRRIELTSHAKAINRRLLREQSLQRPFIQITAHKNTDFGRTALIENAPDLMG